MNLKGLNLMQCRVIKRDANEVAGHPAMQLILWAGLTEQVRMNKQLSGNNLTLHH